MQILKLAPENRPTYSTLSTLEKTRTIILWLTEKRANQLVAFDLSQEHTLTEAAVIVNATSARHAQGLADFVLESCKKFKFEILRTEGYQVAQWILLDLNDIVVHIFQPEARLLYRLEDLWPSAEIVADQRNEELP